MSDKPTYPVAKTYAHIQTDTTLWPVVTHEAKFHLPLQAVVELLKIPASVVNDITRGPLAAAFDVRALMPSTGTLSNEPVQMIALDRLQVMLAAWAMFNVAQTAAFELSRAIAPLLRVQQWSLAGRTERNERTERIEPNTLRITVAVEGGSPTLNRALGDHLLQLIDRVEGTRVEDVPPAHVPPTKH